MVPATLNYSQERQRSYDAQPWQSLRAILLPARRRTIIVTSQVEQVVRHFHCMRLNGANRFLPRILPVQQVFQGIANRDHHHRLSSSTVSDGFDHNENGLTHAQASFAPGANSNV
jgi:hypothetical protein